MKFHSADNSNIANNNSNIKIINICPRYSSIEKQLLEEIHRKDDIIYNLMLHDKTTGQETHRK